MKTLTHTSCHGDGIPLDHEIDVDVPEAQEQVSNIAADGIDGGRCGSAARRLEGLSDFREQFSKRGELPQII